MSLSVLHNFAGPTSDGSYPHDSLILSASGTTLYGMTRVGGTNDFGTIFSIPTNAETYPADTTILHNFAGQPGGDGSSPYGSLILSTSGTTLYGMTQNGGTTNNFGTIFSIQTSGGTTTILHNFAGQPGGDGSNPYSSLILSTSGTTLYGMTRTGGTNDLGTIFSIPTNAETYPADTTILHNFAGVDGAIPYGSLILSTSGTTLYGMTRSGGTNDFGTIFSIPTSGGTITILHNFAGQPGGDGSDPFGSLILSGTTLYGMTQRGGTNDLGTIFSIPTSGGTTTILHNFAGQSGGDGSSPYGSLILSTSGTTLYGMTYNGGTTNNFGTIFSIPTSAVNGSTTILHNFAGQPSDGLTPFGSLILSTSGTTLYGMTVQGGTNNIGTIFSIPAPTPAPTPAPAISNICFPAGTPIDTDQGIVDIDQIDTSYHTIYGKRILDITQTTTLDRYLVKFNKDSLGPNWPNADTIMSKDHKVIYKKKLIPAYKFLDMSSEIKRVKYSGEVLYNVLMENYELMYVNNLICETLHPDNLIAKIYKNRFSDQYNDKVITIMNYYLDKKKYNEYKTIVNRIDTSI